MMPLPIFILEVAALSVTILVMFYLYTYLVSPLKDIPGPFLAKFTNAYRLLDHYNSTQIRTQREAHAKYGPAVRLGPNFVVLNDPSLVKIIFSSRGSFLKSAFYDEADAVHADGTRAPTIFSERRNAEHATALKPIQKLYSMHSILSFESSMDNTITALCQQLDKRFVEGENKGKVFDISNWMGYHAWDVVGEITWGKPMGFLTAGFDVNKWMQTSNTIVSYFGIIGQMPSLDKWLARNPYFPLYIPTFSDTARFAHARLQERYSEIRAGKEQDDYLTRLLEAQKKYPEILVNDANLVNCMLVNVGAGADTTAIGLESTLYNILSHPRVLKTLQAELTAARLSFPPPYSSLATLPYLSACVSESLRYMPVIGTCLERVVPAAGLTLPDGRFLPAGTVVGMAQAVAGRDREVYGDDADAFRPERWLPQSEGPEEESRLRRMRDADLGFGKGSRVCLGRQWALMEICKVIAALVGRYEMELQGEWKVRYQFFNKLDDIKVKIRPRVVI